VLGSLEDLLQDLSQWRSEYDAAREVSDLIAQQEALKDKTGELGKQTLTRSRERLSPQERADLSRLSERQKKQADQFDQLQSRLKEKVDSAPDSASGAAAALSARLPPSVGTSGDVVVSVSPSASSSKSRSARSTACITVASSW